jgi:hypothetical protein
VVPLFKAGKMHFPMQWKEHPAIIEMIGEISKATFSGFKSAHDDAIDTLNQLPEIEVWRPGSAEDEDKAVKEEDESGIWGDDMTESQEGDPSYFV